jgi:hypothetical protein
VLDFNEGVDYTVNHGLLNLVTASTLFAWLCAQCEADVDPTATYVGGQCVQVGTTVITAGSLTSSSRNVDLGVLDFTAAATGTPRSVVVSTKTPGSGALLLAAQDLSFRSGSDLSVTHNSTGVTSATAAFVAADAGAAIIIAGVVYRISSVTNATTAVLTAVYAGSTGTGVAWTVTGSTIDLSTQGPLIVDDLKLLVGYLTAAGTVV